MNQFKIDSMIYFNDDESESLEFLKGIKGEKAFIVADSIMDKLGYLEKTISHLKHAKITCSVFTGVKPDPDTSTISNGIKEYKKTDADIIIALGGGSAIDTAKAIIYYSAKLSDNHLSKHKPLFIAIPSTSGTGSEVTDFSVITSDGQKICIIDDLIVPDIALLDATCIQHVPKNVVADTGIDVLVHAIEAYISTKATDFTDALAEKSIKIIFEDLETVYLDIHNTAARRRILNASCIAGMAFSNTGLGINHSLAHALGSAFNISHGRANALVLQEVMRYNGDLDGKANNTAAHKFSNLAKQLYLPARTVREGAYHFIAAVKELQSSINIERDLKSFGIDELDLNAQISYLAENALNDRCTPTNPRKVTIEDLVRIYRNCYELSF
ncbi:iron-containing alcohol dehydrogenase [Alkaliphilus metalliredigens QYMF]|uniref:Iron-containing alcohol dehydrogenase n=1 Tax=Alkaliphilus metalliredigens (strain QYMF) TaxID=293826 RepID=A6TUU1_ALKMQ|nr:1-propanol dehydrogenase PduQ [Alkaliphilus metalliredigens]ABR49959.1 iron-containing alcohol dehydrogenase [Alkaliphilus metalliredigens QYMF]